MTPFEKVGELSSLAEDKGQAASMSPTGIIQQSMKIYFSNGSRDDRNQLVSVNSRVNHQFIDKCHSKNYACYNYYFK